VLDGAAEQLLEAVEDALRVERLAEVAGRLDDELRGGRAQPGPPSSPMLPLAQGDNRSVVGQTSALLAAALALPTPRPIGAGPLYRPPPTSAAVARAVPVEGLRCSRALARRFGVHLELFAKRLVVIVPAGIGIAPPLRRDGAYVRGGRCSYPARTREPTGVIEIEDGARLTLGEFFDLWGQPLSSTRLAGFRGRVTAFVGGRRRPGDPRTIPLARHAQIVLEVDGYVRPHASFLFPRGL
jgi:hypothetical protein